MQRKFGLPAQKQPKDILWDGTFRNLPPCLLWNCSVSVPLESDPSQDSSKDSHSCCVRTRQGPHVAVKCGHEMLRDPSPRFIKPHIAKTLPKFTVVSADSQNGAGTLGDPPAAESPCQSESQCQSTQSTGFNH